MNFFELAYSLRSFATWIGSTLAATAVFWLCFATCVAGCVDTPLPDVEPQARVVASWDPLLCGDPHRVVLELEDDDGRMLSRSVPCTVAGITIDIAHWGVYRGKIYAWTVGPEIRAVTQVRLDVDAPVVIWTVDTPR
ncbi:MAG TPA: hypothetical protein VIV40_06220 [Kofleriaceae bacterium]